MLPHRSFATLFDHRYMPQGLALYESLKKHSSGPFTLHVLAMDDLVYATLSLLNVLDCENIALHRLAEFEQEMGLTEIKKSRTHQEFCWTCASQFCEYLMKSGLTEITYLDADCWAFSDLEVAFDEIGDRSIAIALHRLIPLKKHLEINGRWNVGWMTFRDTPSGRACLAKWARQVRERCSAEIGCGDQFYLEEFIPDHGNNVCSFENIGVNAAPWNIGNWRVTEGPCVDGVPIVTFHAHGFEMRADGTFRMTSYKLREEDVKFIYLPYVESVVRARNLIESLHIPA